MTTYRVLSIAGAAARGGAGIQADLKTCQELGVYGMSAITAIVAKNPRTGQNIFPQTLDAIEAQIDTALCDIGADVIKTGMLFTTEIIYFVAGQLRLAQTDKIVVDPVMIGKIGSALLQDDAMQAMKTAIIPQATIITPNMPEAEKLLGYPQGTLKNIADLKHAAKTLHALGPTYVLVKGGRLEDDATDVLYDGTYYYVLHAPRIDTIHTNGAGCTYSAAIAAELAKGTEMVEAVTIAKRFITAAIRHGKPIGNTVGPTHHAAFNEYGETTVKVSIEHAN